MGESYSLSYIYCQHVQILFRYGKKFIHDDDVVKDAIQDLFYDLIRTREKLGDTDNIKFYLIKSLRRKLVAVQQRNNKSTGFPITEPKTVEIEYSIENKLICNEETKYREDIIRHALSEINPKQREILFYKFMCGFDYHQICEIMELKYDSARKLVFRSLKSLKEVLSNIEVLDFL